MKIYSFQTQHKKILADTITPVSIYLKIRDQFAGSLLLESSDYHSSGNSFSYICCNPVASITVENETIVKQFPDGSKISQAIGPQTKIADEVHQFASLFESQPNDFKGISNGLFGFISYDAVRYFEKIDIPKQGADLKIPDLHYAIYKNIIAINHFYNEAYLFSHSLDGNHNLETIEQLIQTRNFAAYAFSKSGDKQANLSDEEFKEQVRSAKKHCFRGDVFQLVLSRRFTQKFKGDEFNVYRALRSINPSPYLFFFDYGNFRIFGSSPEAQLVVKNRKAEIHPIAGTFKRSGNDEQDAELAHQLSIDPKENAEHVMLVDLARNDLSRNSRGVTVEKYREIQFFSHVLHMVSKVTGILNENSHTMQAVADTFPAGTLSGAPKYKAMQLIAQIEPSNRSFYGGAIGFMDFEGNFNHAIMIRTFLSKNHELHYQAGAGVVAASDEDSELQEVYNKLGALDKALDLAENI